MLPSIHIDEIINEPDIYKRTAKFFHHEILDSDTHQKMIVLNVIPSLFLSNQDIREETNPLVLDKMYQYIRTRFLENDVRYSKLLKNENLRQETFHTIVRELINSSNSKRLDYKPGNKLEKIILNHPLLNTKCIIWMLCLGNFKENYRKQLKLHKEYSIEEIIEVASSRSLDSQYAFYVLKNNEEFYEWLSEKYCINPEDINDNWIKHILCWV